jgi:hypothetical protein
MKNAVRITVRQGKIKRRFVVTKAPFPDVGDICDLPGSPGWEVVSTKTTSAFSIKFPAVKTKRLA